MGNVFYTLLWGHPLLPETHDSGNKLLLRQLLDMPSNEKLSLPPDVFYRVYIGTACWSGPPIYSFLFIELSRLST